MIQPLFNRIGKKAKILPALMSHFPKYDIFIEPFAGTGIVGLNSGADFVFLNDLDAHISETWHLIQDQQKRDALIDYIEDVPYSDLVFQDFKTMKPANEIEKIARFLILSNWGYMGGTKTLRFGAEKSKSQTLKKLKQTFKSLCMDNIQWHCKDFRDFIASIAMRGKDRDRTFIYCDPPYLDTHQDTYDTPTFKAQDLTDLVEICIAKGCKFAVSEFENDTILMLAEKHSLHINVVKEVQNLKNRRTEILLTNYKVSEGALFD